LLATAAHESVPKYTSRIIKAGALLDDTHNLFAHWDLDASPAENIDRLRRENVFGKASRSRVEDVLAIFRQRYLQEEEVARALAILLQRDFPTRSLDRLFYFHATQSDLLLHDTVTELLAPLYATGVSELPSERLYAQLRDWVYEGLTAARWSEPTTRRILSGLLATLRDFGVLSGTVNKRIVTPLIPVEAFAYIAFYLHQSERSGDRLLNSTEWQLFFLSPEGVERLFLEAHQRRLLDYQAAGRVVRVEFPAELLVEYAHALAQRAH